MRERIDRMILGDGVDGLLGVLGGASRGEMRYAARRLADRLAGSQSVLGATADLVLRDGSTARHLACQLIPYAYREEASASLEWLERLAADADWAVRDAAARTCGRLLRDEFPGLLAPLRAWRDGGTAPVRRAVVVASRRAATPARLERAEPLLRFLEPLLSDEDAAVRRELGPRALGAALLRSYETITFEYLVKWSTSNDAAVLWNVAMAFSAPPAASIARKALIVLRKLSLDERRLVRRAVSASMWRLGRRAPEVVRPELMRWLEDEQRAPVAREALRHL